MTNYCLCATIIKRGVSVKFNKIKNNKIAVTIIYVLLRLSVVTVMVAQFFNKNYNDVFLCGLTLVLFFIPDFLDKKFKIELPHTLEIIILLFIYSAEILGEIRGFYLSYPHWDTMLHTLNGFLMAAIGFSLIDILNRTEKIHFMLSPLFVAIVAFCFSMTVGVLWEFFEFSMDSFTGTDMQKDTLYSTVSTVTLNPDGRNVPVIIEEIESTKITGAVDGARREMEIKGGYLDLGIYDTMEDLLVNFIGAFVFSILGMLYIKSKGNGKLLPHFIIKFKKQKE